MPEFVDPRMLRKPLLEMWFQRSAMGQLKSAPWVNFASVPTLGGHLQHLALRYTQALITQMAQTAVCNRHYALDQQLCRWLLLSLDRLEGNELVMTQELIANMRGVRRKGVTEAAGKLQAEGLIQYSRGHIKVLDRPRLEKRVCKYYAVVKKEYDRLIPYKTHSLPNTTA